MPELPEVETTLRGLECHLKKKQVQDIQIRCQPIIKPTKK